MAILEAAVVFCCFLNEPLKFNYKLLSEGKNKDMVVFLLPAVMVAAASNVRTWALDREVFHNIMRMTAEARHEQYRNFLRR